MVMETSRLADGKVLETTVLRIDGDRLRVDTDGGENSVVYHADQQLLWMLDHGDRSYFEIDQEMTAGLARSIDRLNKEARSRLGSLPPEQRKSLEGLLDKTLGPGSEEKRPEIVVVPTGDSDVLEGKNCRVYEVLRDGQRVADVCRAEFSDVGLQPQTLDAVRGLATFLRETVTALAPDKVRNQGLDALDSFDRLDGVPLRVRSYEDGKPVRQSRVTNLEDQAFPGSDFEVPSGYNKEIGLNIREHVGKP